MIGTPPAADVARQRRVARLLVAAVALVVGAAAGGGLFPGGSAAAAACGPAPAGRVAAVVVVDGPGGISSRCITVAEGAKGAEALVAAGHSIRSEGGFVCGIDGQPATGCAVNSQTAPYWSYWHAPPGGSWSYSGVGAFSYRLPARCAVEGWRLVDPGMPRGQAVPRASSPAVECVAPAPAAAPPPPAPAPAGPSAPAPAAPAPGSRASAGGAPAAGPVSGPNAPPSGPAGSASPAPTVAGAGTVAPATSAPAPGPDDPAASTTTSEGGATTGVEDGPTDGGEARPDRSPGETAEASSTPAAAGTSRGSPVGAATVLAVLVALGVVALVRRRRAVVRGTGQTPLTHNST